ncbi:MAG: hypothetical protein WBF39_08810, partial [Planococcus donghaensis]
IAKRIFKSFILQSIDVLWCCWNLFYRRSGMEFEEKGEVVELRGGGITGLANKLVVFANKLDFPANK